MPYANNANLPKSVKNNLPENAQTIFRKAYNNAEKQYRNPSKRRDDSSLPEVCSRVAWSAVKNEYTKKNDKWIKK